MERTIITTLTADELRWLVAESVEYVIKNFKGNHPSVPTIEHPHYVSKKEAARLLGVRIDLIDSAEKSGRIKRYHILNSKTIRFLRSEVLAIAELSESK